MLVCCLWGKRDVPVISADDWATSKRCQYEVGLSSLLQPTYRLLAGVTVYSSSGGCFTRPTWLRSSNMLTLNELLPQSTYCKRQNCISTVMPFMSLQDHKPATCIWRQWLRVVLLQIKCQGYNSSGSNVLPEGHRQVYELNSELNGPMGRGWQTLSNCIDRECQY